MNPSRLGGFHVFIIGLALLSSPLALPFPANGAHADWPQFRGQGAMGRGKASGFALHWNEQSNIVWKTTLPGPGASSPIVRGDRVYVTCFTGYATSSREPGDMASLKRHLVCLNLADGKIVWDTASPADQPEQEKIRENHGYASATPVIDNERIYAFYGRSGVVAFDHQGKELWNAKVGEKLNGWGSAASPVLFKDLVLVNASVESESLIALDRASGKEVWRTGGVKDSWHPPVLLDAPGGKTEIVLAMIRKIVAFDPEGGAQLWRADTGIPWYMCPTPVAEDGIVYSIGGRNPNGGVAIRSGGRGDITSSHVLWKVNKGSNVPSPILHEGHLYWAHQDLGVIYCVNAKTGQIVYEERLEASPGQIYASPVVAEHRIYFVGRAGRTVVVAAEPKFQVLAVNDLESNRGVFNASPAISSNRLLIRSNRALYAIGK